VRASAIALHGLFTRRRCGWRSCLAQLRWRVCNPAYAQCPLPTAACITRSTAILQTLARTTPNSFPILCLPPLQHPAPGNHLQHH